MQRSTLFVFAAAIALAAGAFTAPASAAEQRVGYADLDRSNAAGADVLINRIRQSARIACGDEPGPTALRHYVKVRECRRDAEWNALSALGDDRIRARYAERFHRSGSITVAMR